jgi:hypothetical protein
MACCSLYMAKNTVNSPVILRIIDSYVDDLLASPAPETPIEILARLQALLLYHTIRLFDGDIRSRASAERAMPAIESAAFAVLHLLSFDEDKLLSDQSSSTRITEVGLERPGLDTTDITGEFWKEWVFQESARRTFLFTFYFDQLYRWVAGEQGFTDPCDNRMALCRTWTMSAHLWNATSLLDFEIAWKGQPHFIFSPTTVPDILLNARASDVDIFGRMLLVGILGLDDAKVWFYRRGGEL